MDGTPGREKVDEVIFNLTFRNKFKSVGITAIVQSLRSEQKDGERPYSKPRTREIAEKLVAEGKCTSDRPGYFKSVRARGPKKRVKAKKKKRTVKKRRRRRRTIRYRRPLFPPPLGQAKAVSVRGKKRGGRGRAFKPKRPRGRPPTRPLDVRMKRRAYDASRRASTRSQDDTASVSSSASLIKKVSPWRIGRRWKTKGRGASSSASRPTADRPIKKKPAAASPNAKKKRAKSKSIPKIPLVWGLIPPVKTFPIPPKFVPVRVELTTLPLVGSRDVIPGIPFPIPNRPVRVEPTNEPRPQQQNQEAPPGPAAQQQQQQDEPPSNQG